MTPEQKVKFQVLREELQAARKRIRRLEDALECVVPSCAYLHHRKKHRHGALEDCPAEALIREVKL